MNAKDLIGKKIIDKNVKDLAKLAEIDINIKTFSISNLYGSIGNPINKKYYNIPSDSILAVGDYIQVGKTTEELESEMLEKIPETEGNIIKLNSLIGKTVLNSEGNITGKVINVEVDFKKKAVCGIRIASSTSSFGQNKTQTLLSKEDITSIGDYVLINKVFEVEKEESEDSEESVKINVE